MAAGRTASRGAWSSGVRGKALNEIVQFYTALSFVWYLPDPTRFALVTLLTRPVPLARDRRGDHLYSLYDLNVFTQSRNVVTIRAHNGYTRYRVDPFYRKGNYEALLAECPIIRKDFWEPIFALRGGGR